VISISRTASSPEDRVLLIVGLGHCPLLRELVQADARLKLVEPQAAAARRW
jgi:spermidine synthase